MYSATYFWYNKTPNKCILIGLRKSYCVCNYGIDLETLGQILKRDTPAYLLIRRRIPVSIFGTDSQNQLRIDIPKIRRV